jgi:hypothetical protein
MEKLSAMKENSNTFLERTKEELNIKYEIFNNEILKYINIATNKVINAFQFDISKINEEKSKLIHDFSMEKINILKRVISLHQQIIDVIQQNFLILQNFLQIFELIDKEHPIQDFLNKEFDNIIKSWLFLKLDLEKYNFKNVINNSNLNQNYKDFIIKECQGKNSVMNIIFSEEEFINKKEKKKIISENMSHLEKLNMKNVPCIDDYLGKSKFDKLKTLKLTNSISNNNNIFKQFPFLTKLKINFCPLLDMTLFTQINHTHLKKLILNKNNLVNQDFNYLIEHLLKSPNITMCCMSIRIA